MPRWLFPGTSANESKVHLDARENDRLAKSSTESKEPGLNFRRRGTEEPGWTGLWINMAMSRCVKSFIDRDLNCDLDGSARDVSVHAAFCEGKEASTREKSNTVATNPLRENPRAEGTGSRQARLRHKSMAPRNEVSETSSAEPELTDFDEEKKPG